LCNAQQVREAFATLSDRSGFAGVTVQRFVRGPGAELIAGVSVDPQLGPMLLFGAGGIYAEALADRALGLPPLNTTLARRMIEQTRIGSALRDRSDMWEILIQLSRLAIDLPAVRELDVNPLVLTDAGVVAVDARVVLFSAEVPTSDLPKPAIRPYPVEYVGVLRMNNGESLTVRPIRPEDEPKMVRFHSTLSDQSVYYRYCMNVRLDRRVAHERLSRLCFLDYDRELALVAERGDEIVAVARLIKLPGTRDAEFALIVSDSLQHRGVGKEMLKRLLVVGKDWKVERVVAEILAENASMRHVCRALGFQFVGATGAFIRM
jgi:acetyltransferase